jgi:chaperonin GroEL
MLSSSFRRFISKPKELKFGPEITSLILEGVEKLSTAVVATLGPKGRNVMIDHEFGGPKVTKDGVTVAKEIEIADKWQNMGAQLVISVAQKTNDTSGDGTTTATLLTRELYREAIKGLSAGLNPADLRRGINRAVDTVLKELAKLTKPVNTPEEIAQVASISANGNIQIGRLISDAFAAVGKEGVITVQTGKTFEHKLTVSKGLKIDRGYISPYFLTDAKTMKAELENPLVLVTSLKIGTFATIQPLLEQVAKRGRPLLILADDVDGDALAALIVNKVRGSLKVVAVKAPGFGENKRFIMEDLAIVTGAKLISEELGVSLEKVGLDYLGSCDNVTVTKDDTVLVGGAAAKEAVAARADEIRQMISVSESNYEKEKFRERLGKLVGGVAVIEVGGGSDLEVNETKDLIEDAMNATRAAIEEGIVPGGGVAFLNASKALAGLKTGSLEEKTGIDIVRRAVQQPLKWIANNAGLPGDVVCEKVLAGNDPNFGFDAKAGEYGDLIKRGIVDPVKVVKATLANAASVVASITSTGVMIAAADEEKPK